MKEMSEIKMTEKRTETHRAKWMYETKNTSFLFGRKSPHYFLFILLYTRNNIISNVVRIVLNFASIYSYQINYIHMAYAIRFLTHFIYQQCTYKIVWPSVFHSQNIQKVVYPIYSYYAYHSSLNVWYTFSDEWYMTLSQNF